MYSEADCQWNEISVEVILKAFIYNFMVIEFSTLHNLIGDQIYVKKYFLSTINSPQTTTPYWISRHSDNSIIFALSGQSRQFYWKWGNNFNANFIEPNCIRLSFIIVILYLNIHLKSGYCISNWDLNVQHKIVFVCKWDPWG